MIAKHALKLVAVAGVVASQAHAETFRVGNKGTNAATADAIDIRGGAGGSDFRFDFRGTIVSGSAVGGPSLAGSSFTFSLFVQDLTDLTPGSNTANYRIAKAVMDIGSNGTADETTFPNPLGFAALFIDPGATQLIGGMDLFNPGLSFLIGVLIPGNTFTDPKNLAGQDSFQLSGLAASTLSYYNSGAFNLVLDPTTFGFDNGLTILPLPAPVAMGALGLVCAGFAVRRWKRTA